MLKYKAFWHNRELKDSEEVFKNERTNKPFN